MLIENRHEHDTPGNAISIQNDPNKIQLSLDEEKRTKRGRRPNHVRNYAAMHNNSDLELDDDMDDSKMRKRGKDSPY